jgi:glycosyltransferase involved in cell wall biosynthesis
MTSPVTIPGHKRLDVVLPAFNEEANLQRVVTGLLSASWPKDFDVFAIIVDDGSTDSTLNVAQALESASDHVHIIHHKRNSGYGGAVAEGIAQASGDYVAIMDADGQFAPDDLIRLCGFLTSHDIVVGYRARRADHLGRRFLGRLGSFLARLLFRTRLRDLNCGLKVFRRNLIEPLRLRCRGPGINLEIFALLAGRNPNVKEMTVEHFPRKVGAQTGGRVKTLIRLLPESLSVLWRCRFP